jgi:hypothetical protein
LEVNLTIFDGQDGPEVIDEDGSGAVTVANMNDTDADYIPDSADSNGVEETRTGGDKEGEDEKDLMKLIIHRPEPYTGGPVFLTASPPDRVMLWADSKKKVPLTGYEPVSGTMSWDPFPADDIIAGVEIKTESQTVADVSLTLSYGGKSDTVKATGVWAEKTADVGLGEVPRSWAQLAGTIWRTQMDEALQKFLKPEFFGGTGERPKRIVEGKSEFHNVMAMRFTVSPVGVTDHLPRVRFDITRQMEQQHWRLTDFREAAGLPPTLDTEVGYPKLWDVGNDDSADEVDESPQPDPSGDMFVIDAPGLIKLESPPPAYVKEWNYNNFREFVRVRLDGKDPVGEVEIPDPMDPNKTITEYVIDGSRCSPKVPWWSRVAAEWDTAWNRIPDVIGAPNNEIDHNDLPFGPQP